MSEKFLSDSCRGCRQIIAMVCRWSVSVPSGEDDGYAFRLRLRSDFEQRSRGSGGWSKPNLKTLTFSCASPPDGQQCCT